jgi:hypothetical protein
MCVVDADEEMAPARRQGAQLAIATGMSGSAVWNTWFVESRMAVKCGRQSGRNSQE